MFTDLSELQAAEWLPNQTLGGHKTKDKDNAAKIKAKKNEGKDEAKRRQQR
jgi:hypothetical protein